VAAKKRKCTKSRPQRKSRSKGISELEIRKEFEPGPGYLEESLRNQALHHLQTYLGIQSGSSVSLNMDKPRYKKAELVVPQKTAKDQRLYIKFYATDRNSGKLKRKRYFKIPGKNLVEKKKNANVLINQINNALADGYMLGSNQPKSLDELPKLKTAISEYKVSKKNNRTYGKRLDMYLKPYLDYCRSSGLLEERLSLLDSKHALKFYDYLTSQNYANRSINNNISYARSIWNWINERYSVSKNPFKGIKPLPNGVGRNLAFTPEQITLLKEQHTKFPDLAVLAEFMYYTLARTNEISLMQLKHIDFQKGIITIPPENSKTGYLRHVLIGTPLRRLLKNYISEDYDRDSYLFSRRQGSINKYVAFSPGNTLIDSKRFGERYRKYILKPLGFSKDYTLYSWKHTGVIMAHNAGVTDADIMQQTGHRNYESFTKYMKSLGLFARGQFAEKIPEL
jgi:integrase